jgi:hypothetical protein
VVVPQYCGLKVPIVSAPNVEDATLSTTVLGSDLAHCGQKLVSNDMAKYYPEQTLISFCIEAILKNHICVPNE